MSNISQKVELTTNVLIGVVAIMLIAFIGQRFLLGSASTNKQPEQGHPNIGKKVALPDIDFSANQKTVVLALQTSCHFCNESVPFYKRLIEENKGKGIRFVAVFPTKVEDGVKHLAGMGITEMEVRQADMSVLDATGTPTFLLVNSRGEVTNFWVGKLPPEKESEVISQLNL